MNYLNWSQENKCYFSIYFFMSTFFKQISVAAPFAPLFIISQIFKLQEFVLTELLKKVYNMLFLKCSHTFALNFEHKNSEFVSELNSFLLFLFF